jgi:hypothetical protein
VWVRKFRDDSIMTNEKHCNGTKSSKTVYCLDCSAFTKDGGVRYDPIMGCPVVDHNESVDRTHHVIFETDIQLLLELGNSLRGQVARYELAEIYCISSEKLDQVLANVGGDL